MAPHLASGEIKRKNVSFDGAPKGPLPSFSAMLSIANAPHSCRFSYLFCTKRMARALALVCLPCCSERPQQGELAQSGSNGKQIACNFEQTMRGMAANLIAMKH